MSTVPLASPTPLRAAVYDRAAIYSRVSTLMQAREGFSLDAQLQDCQALAAQLGATVIGEPFTDNDSGAELDLDGLNAMLDAARRREFDVLIVYAIDRLARNLGKQFVIEEELRRYGVPIRYVTMPVEDSPEGRLLSNMSATIAEYEREKIRVRTSRGRRAKAETGRIVGNGQAPYGYRFTRLVDLQTGKSKVVGLEPDPQTAPVAQRIWREAAHRSLATICEDLNAEGIPPYRYAAVWSPTTLRGMLRNPAYVGAAAYGRRDGEHRWRAASTWITVACPALITEAERDAALAALAARKRYRRRSRTAPAADLFMLRERVTCALCGRGLACQASSGGRWRYYECLCAKPSRARELGKPPCALPRLPAEPLEAAVWEAVTAALLDPAHLAAGLAEGRTQHEAAAERWQAQRKSLDRALGRHRRQLKELVLSQAAARRGSATWQALAQAIEETDTAIASLERERVAAEPRQLPGLSPEQATALTQFADDIRLGLGAVTAEERRHILGLLQLRGRVRPDAGGLRIGRHRVTVEWESVIPLPGAQLRTMGTLSTACS